MKRLQSQLLALVCFLAVCCGFQNRVVSLGRGQPGLRNRLLKLQQSTISPPRSKNKGSVSDISSQIADVRAEMMQDEKTAMMMDALRGKNINDDDRQGDGIDMLVVETRASDGSDGDSLPTMYSPEGLTSYFDKRPEAVFERVYQIVSTSSGFLLSVIGDSIKNSITGASEEEKGDQEVRRAAQLRNTIVSLGPFFIKLGQALSIRPDILSPRAMVELQQLCDKVPCFDSKLAMATVNEELGQVLARQKAKQDSENINILNTDSSKGDMTYADAVTEIFSEISPEPVAAASLGQVYRARLRVGGEEVAVKVQRPYVLETVSLDLFLVRSVGLFVRRFLPTINSRLDIISLLDEFANNFYSELDYVLECENGIKIAEDMKILPKVKIPKNYPHITSRRVHVAEWVEGEKLSQSNADDVGSLVNLGVITYLTQLLDTGFFHADPHPGNMLRTPDGRLVILDFGLMTKITDDQKFGMIEAVAHLIHRDYEKIGDDFVALDFIPKDVDTAPIIPALARVFEAALAGGGAKSINFQELASDLAEITFKFPFRIPPYFALVIRAISVLEGIALVGNPAFAIVDEAYPFISKRLMTSPHPRLKEAFRYMIYGKGDTVDVDRIIDMLTALEKFIAVKDYADGTAFKQGDTRGGTKVGKAGDSIGTKDLGDLKYSGTGENAIISTGFIPTGKESSSSSSDTSGSSTVTASPPSRAGAGEPAPDKDKKMAREALTFFFSQEGYLFREILVDEICKGVDALSRDAARELTISLLGILPDRLFRGAVGSRPNSGPGQAISSRAIRSLKVPSFLKVLAPKLTVEDRRVVDNTIKLAKFLGSRENGGSSSSSYNDSDSEELSEIDAVGSLLPSVVSGRNLARLRELTPVLQEYGPSIRQFASMVATKLVDRVAARVLTATSQAIFS